mgnify:CR=1 FL=1
MSDLSTLFSIIGMTSMVVMLILLGLLSKRMGKVTKTPSYYIGFYVGSAFVFIGVVVRIATFADKVSNTASSDNCISLVLLYNGAPALGITIGVIAAWRYWSWLLAERN